MWREIAVQSTWTTEFLQLDTNRRSIKHPVFKEYGHPSYRFGCIFLSKKNYVWSTFGSVYLKADKKEKYFVFIHGDRNLDLVSFHIRLVPLPFEPFRHLQSRKISFRSFWINPGVYIFLFEPPPPPPRGGGGAKIWPNIMLGEEID